MLSETRKITWRTKFSSVKIIKVRKLPDRFCIISVIYTKKGIGIEGQIIKIWESSDIKFQKNSEQAKLIKVLIIKEKSNEWRLK